MYDLKTWGDLARNYNLVLFNQAPHLGDGEVLDEFTEFCQDKEPPSEDEDFEYPEVFQWYAIGLNQLQADTLNKEFDLDIFFSDYLGIYILPVYHFGTSWDILNLAGGYANEK